MHLEIPNTTSTREIGGKIFSGDPTNFQMEVRNLFSRQVEIIQGMKDEKYEEETRLRMFSELLQIENMLQAVFEYLMKNNNESEGNTSSSKK